MPQQDWTSLVGGFAQGFGNAKNAAKDRALNEEYKKIAMENVKATAKLHEAQIKKLDMEGGLLNWAMGGAAPGGVAALPSEGQVQPQAQQTPVAPQSFSQEVAEKRFQINNPMNPTGGQAPPLGGGVQLVGTTGRSATNNNPGNLTPAPYFEQKYGATLEPPSRSGQQKFLKFKTPQDGYNAVLDQIKIDAGRGHTLASFTSKYAPPNENPTGELIAQYASTLGVSPDTPLANIPPEALAVPLLARESSTKIIPAGQGGQPQPQAQQKPSLTQFQQPQRGVLTREKFLEGYMKKNFGVEPDEVASDRMGDHILIRDKKKGTPLFLIAGQGKVEMVDTTLPDGSVVKRPIVMPPSPVPNIPGVPVINAPGQGGGLMAGPGMQTKPPEYSYEEVTGPGGAKQKIPIPKAQPGGPSIFTEPPKGQSALEAGKMQGAQSGLDAFTKLQGLIYKDDGKVNYKNLGTAVMGGVPWTVGREINGLSKRAVDSIVRAATGATMPESEWKNFVSMYIPTGIDNEQTVNTKMAGMVEYLNGYLDKMDPTGASRLRVGNIKTPTPVKSPEIPKGAKPTGKYSGGKPVYELPDGRGWIPD